MPHSASWESKPGRVSGEYSRARVASRDLNGSLRGRRGRQLANAVKLCGPRLSRSRQSRRLPARGAHAQVARVAHPRLESEGVKTQVGSPRRGRNFGRKAGDRANGYWTRVWSGIVLHTHGREPDRATDFTHRCALVANDSVARPAVAGPLASSKRRKNLGELRAHLGSIKVNL
ncbi:hypothetical protein FRUB_01528 [Fimbriiglobus ruber]|uniref:Uncharacterized protein n=1 Tax=Fimbriiglobus ruber TaxID=1908690 RepID=A0A225E9U6_9BACT|nr:hypothetical protein FRUB_01528 [Fimbriiglobus ruber]